MAQLKLKARPAPAPTPSEGSSQAALPHHALTRFSALFFSFALLASVSILCPSFTVFSFFSSFLECQFHEVMGFCLYFFFTAYPQWLQNSAWNIAGIQQIS